MTKRMLIDAAHPEETRVVVLNGNRLDEFDFETSTKKQIKGNIYLAKVTRVEPSLQAAFVEYGGNRHGFLAFSEIHPDYYRIPVADRQAALAADRAAAEREQEEVDAEEDAAQDAGDSDIQPSPRMLHESAPDQVLEVPVEPQEFADLSEAVIVDGAGDALDVAVPSEALAASLEPVSAAPVSKAVVTETPDETATPVGDADHAHDLSAHASSADDASAHDHAAHGHDHHHDNAATSDEAPPADGEPNTADASDGDHVENGDHHIIPVDHPEDTVIETVGGDEIEEASRRRARPARHYKIQEVIKRRQIMLVQVTKEERGNKGAALTTYLSLAGRYCVLMPNTPRGGGVSRKITSVTDRRRLKDLMSDLDVPDGMGVIVRTAGSERSKAEIKRDFEYLIRLWDEIRDVTLQSTAPALIYEEGNLIKRSIRDLYTRDLEEVIVDGDEGYKTAKAFMKMLMPSHAKRVKPYRDPSIPLFHRFQIESQIDLIHSPVVQLRSGGYIVINPTEALVAIDVNSGRSTKERNIEETALKTNIEAAEEVARQLRLRDLAGLIVIDFIDMEESRNQAAVERRLKEAMRNDRARIQLGRISPFGLLELSRQRLRPSLIEASTQPCPHCNGTGNIRSTESTALHILRAIEEEGMRRRSAEISVAVPTSVALYILNQKRTTLQLAEAHYGFSVTVTNDDSLIPPAFRLDRLRAFTTAEIAALPIMLPPTPEIEEEDDSDRIPDDEDGVVEADADDAAAETTTARREEEGGGRGRRRRRRRRSGEEGRSDEAPDDEAQADTLFAEDRSAPLPVDGADAGEDVENAAVDGEGDETDAVEGGEPSESARTDGGDADRKRRRRGRRGGRRRRRGAPGQDGSGVEDNVTDEHAQQADAVPTDGDAPAADENDDEHGEWADGVTQADDPASVDAAWRHEHPGTTTAETVEIIPAPPDDEDSAVEIETVFSDAVEIMGDAGLDIAAIPVGEHSDREMRLIEADADVDAVPQVAKTADVTPVHDAEPAADEERQPVQYNIPEPHEVTGPPPNPRRGWWRRG
jgi:ribonuclease E